MPLINKLFGRKQKSSLTKITEKKEENKKSETEIKKSVMLDSDKKINSKILISPLTTEKALFGQNLNKYIFKVLSSSNKIEIAKEIGRTYNVKAVSIRVINIRKKAIRVGRTLGFKAGYKKAVVTLAKGQSIEIK